MAFPCFDQPDLKANFLLDIEHPAHWAVIANTIATPTDETHTRFEETRPISTYLFAFAAGPFEAVHAKNEGGPTVYVRKSQMARAEQEAPQMQQMAARGIGYFRSSSRNRFPSPSMT